MGAAEKHQDAYNENPLEAPGIQNARIMVVEDNDYNRDILRRRLKKEGYDVVEAVNGRLALEALKTEKVDMILLDIMMPEMDGFQVLENLKSDDKLKNIPVIVISALSEVDNAVKCIELGAEDHLPKPFSPTLLRARINSGLTKKMFFDRELQYKEFIESQNRNLEERVRKSVIHKWQRFLPCRSLQNHVTRKQVNIWKECVSIANSSHRNYRIHRNTNRSLMTNLLRIFMPPAPYMISARLVFRIKYS